MIILQDAAFLLEHYTHTHTHTHTRKKYTRVAMETLCSFVRSMLWKGNKDFLALRIGLLQSLLRFYFVCKSSEKL